MQSPQPKEAPAAPLPAGGGWACRIQPCLIVVYALSLPVSLTASWCVLIAGMVTAIVALLRARPARPTMPPLTWPLAVFALAVAAAGLGAGGPQEALMSLVTLRALLVYFWAYFVFAADAMSPARALSALLSMSALAGFWGAFQQVSGFHPFAYQWLQGTGFHSGPMAFAGQMQLFAAMAAGLAVAGGWKHLCGPCARAIPFAFIAAGNLAGLIFAAERSAWIGALAAGLYMSCLLSWRTALKCLLGIVLCSFLLFAFVPVVKQRLSPLADWQNDVSVRVRLFLWRESLESWRGAPILGVGIRSFPRFDIPEAIVPGRSSVIDHAHSNYLQILTTTGIVGLAAYIYLWLSAFALALRSMKTSADCLSRSLYLGLSGGIVSLLVSGAFEYNFGTAQVRLAQWFLLALLPAAAGRPQPGHNSTTPNRSEGDGSYSGLQPGA